MEESVPKKSRMQKKKLDDLLDLSLGGSSLSPEESFDPGRTDLALEGPNLQGSSKNKLKVYVLSGQIKDLYGKIINY